MGRTLDGVDAARMCGRGELDRGDAGVQDRDPVVAFGCECRLLRHAEHIAVEPDGPFEVVGLDDQTQLRGRSDMSHATHCAARRARRHLFPGLGAV